MSSFQDRLLTDVSGLCKALFTRRLRLVREQQRVSEKAREDHSVLVTHLDGLRRVSPFPAETSVDLAPLDDLRRSLDRPDFDPLRGQEIIMDWVRAFRPVIVVASAAAVPPPLNERMIEALAGLRKAIDRKRVALLRDRDRYDRDAYTAARNAFTLARSVYAERLRLGQINCTNEEVREAEDDLMTAISQATGATFPGAIQAAADFMEIRVFPEVA